jgi:hypothetical protein
MEKGTSAVKVQESLDILDTLVQVSGSFSDIS